MGELAGKVALVTGGTSGIGVETVRALHATGADVFFTARDSKRGAETQQEIAKRSTGKGRLQVIMMDLDSLESVRQAAQDFLSRSNKLNILVNNAGMWPLAIRSFFSNVSLYRYNGNPLFQDERWIRETVWSEPSSALLVHLPLAPNARVQQHSPAQLSRRRRIFGCPSVFQHRLRRLWLRETHGGHSASWPCLRQPVCTKYWLEAATKLRAAKQARMPAKSRCHLFMHCPHLTGRARRLESAQ